MRVRRKAECSGLVPGGPNSEGIVKSREHGNQFGLVVAIEEDGRELPINCGHGGSCWLCLECAEEALEKNKEEK